MSNREQTPAGHGKLVRWIADSRYVKQGADGPAGHGELVRWIADSRYVKQGTDASRARRACDMDSR
jgi:UDP-N-acetylglucosamine pyrophosphorylase